MRQNYKKIVPILIIVGVVLTIIITNRKSTPLPGYDVSNDVFTTEAESKKSYEGSIHTDEATGFSIFIPEDWQYVVKSGFPTYVHKPSASSIQIQSLPYDPTVNAVNVDAIAADLSASGGSLVGLDWFSNSSYVIKYMLPTGDDYTDYVEIVDYDKEHLIRVIYTFSDLYYKDLIDLITYSMDSVVWDKQSPFPNDVAMHYSSLGDFEFASPIGWSDGYGDNVYFAQDPNTGASYNVMVNESSALYTDYTQLDYVSYAGNGRNNFSVSSYYADSHVIQAEGSYYANNARIMIRQYLIASGEYEYMVTEECPADSYPAVAQVLDDLLDCFRVFAPMRNPVSDTDSTDPAQMNNAQYEEMKNQIENNSANLSQHIANAAEAANSTEVYQEETETVLTETQEETSEPEVPIS